MSQTATTVGIATASTIIATVIPCINRLLKSIVNSCINLVLGRIVIRADQYLSYFAITQELKALRRKTKTQIVMDGASQPIYVPANGRCLKRVSIPGYKNKKFILFCISDKEITLRRLGSVKPLIAYFQHIYKKYNSSDTSVPYYPIGNNGWSRPNIRRPRLVPPSSFTESMVAVLESVDTFVNTEYNYAANGQNYRIGYMLHGKPGTGKSSLAEIIASKYGMSVYTIQLNNQGTTDASIINACQSVPPRSIIIFDEIDKQFESVTNNKTVHVSKSGLLGAIDGVPKLPHGTIVIMTANDLSIFDDFRDQLFRAGRIDHVIELTGNFR